MNMFIYTTRRKKTVPNCGVSFANSELRQTYGHMTLTMSTWPKYGHRSLVGYRLPYQRLVTLIVNVMWPYAWWNIAVRYSCLRLVVYMNIFIAINPTWWTFTNIYAPSCRRHEINKPSDVLLKKQLIWFGSIVMHTQLTKAFIVGLLQTSMHRKTACVKTDEALRRQGEGQRTWHTGSCSTGSQVQSDWWVAPCPTFGQQDQHSETMLAQTDTKLEAIWRL